MSNTVEYKGNIYEIGKYYRFSNNKSYWTVELLDSISGGGGLIASNGSSQKDHYDYISEVGEIGTITKAPIKLVDGADYQFDYGSNPELLLNIGLIGTYDSNGTQGCFWVKEVPWYIQDCSSIVKLIPEVSNE